MDDGPATEIHWAYGEMSCTVTMRTHLSPDMVDDILLKARRQFVAGVRQLGMVMLIEDDAEDQP